MKKIKKTGNFKQTAKITPAASPYHSQKIIGTASSISTGTIALPTTRNIQIIEYHCKDRHPTIFSLVAKESIKYLTRLKVSPPATPSTTYNTIYKFPFTPIS